MASHPISRHQVVRGRPSINSSENPIPSTGSHGTPGVRNGRTALGSLRRRWITATQTSRNSICSRDFFFFLPLPFSLVDLDAVDFDSADLESEDFESFDFESEDLDSEVPASFDFESDESLELEEEPSSALATEVLSEFLPL